MRFPFQNHPPGFTGGQQGGNCAADDKDKGGVEEEGVLGGNEREGTPECGSERRNFKHWD